MGAMRLRGHAIQHCEYSTVRRPRCEFRADEAIPRLRQVLVEAGLEVTSIVEVEPGLEEVFVALARGEQLIEEQQ